VTVGVMRIRHMRMGMPLRLVPMPVTVLTDRHGVVYVTVMPIVVSVRVFVLERLVVMLVCM
jgi:hypothetical protein